MKGGRIMLVDSTDREEMDDVRLARTHPAAYEAKMNMRKEYNPIKDLIDSFKKLLAKKAK